MFARWYRGSKAKSPAPKADAPRGSILDAVLSGRVTKASSSAGPKDKCSRIAVAKHFGDDDEDELAADPVKLEELDESGFLDAVPDIAQHNQDMPDADAGADADADAQSEAEESEDDEVMGLMGTDEYEEDTESDQVGSHSASPEPAEDGWEIDPEVLDQYEASKRAMKQHVQWTKEEARLHRLLSLRGFYPLMPASWKPDFAGVPMLYPAIFAQPGNRKPVLIHHKAGQFRATKAMRSIFDLQARVSGLRQVGATRKIAPTIEKELRRYLQWAKQDAGLDRYDYKSNIAIKRFSATRLAGGDLADRVEVFFSQWASAYRESYAAGLPEGVEPPRILYGFVVVQHLVTLLTIDAARPGAKPRYFAEWNMSKEGRWLDSSLNIAIPVHMAREAMLRIADRLPLVPVIEISDDDA